MAEIITSTFLLAVTAFEAGFAFCAGGWFAVVLLNKIADGRRK